MNTTSLLEELYQRKSSTFTLGLEPVKELAAKLGNPEERMNVIHVAGTNGKGSTSLMIFHILKAAGYKVGLYTSPHLKQFNERFRVNDALITDKEIARYYQQIKSHITNQSFFEITTLLGFLYFKDKKCDCVVVETGLGGRLDATNIVTPLLSVITMIGIEHTNYLGNTIEKIAQEKAGIIKKGRPVVVGEKGKGLSTIQKTAQKMNAPCTLVSWDIMDDLSFLPAKYQRQNAMIALTAIEVLQHYTLTIPKKAISAGLRQATFPGRFEFIEENVVVDCAHNVSGFQVLENELASVEKEKVIVVSLMKDKDIPEIMKIVNRMASRIVLTKAHSDRASDPLELAKRCKKPFVILEDPQKAVDAAKKERNALTVICGSFYLVGEFV